MSTLVEAEPRIGDRVSVMWGKSWRPGVISGRMTWMLVITLERGGRRYVRVDSLGTRWRYRFEPAAAIPADQEKGR